MDIPVVLKPVVVPVPPTIVPVEIENIAVAIRVAKKCIKCRPYHRPLKSNDDLGAESYSVSKIP